MQIDIPGQISNYENLGYILLTHETNFCEKQKYIKYL